MPRIDRPRAPVVRRTEVAARPATTETTPLAPLATGYSAPRPVDLAALLSVSTSAPSTAHTLGAAIEFGPRGFAFDQRDTHDPAGLTRGVVNTLYQSALKLSALAENPFDKLTIKARKQILEHLVPFALKDSRYRGRPSSISLKSRTSAYAMMLMLAESMVTRTERGARTKLFDFLLSAAEHEAHPGVRGQLLSGLQEVDKRALSGTQARKRKTLVASISPKQPPYAKWFAPGKASEVKAVQYVQDEFWRGEIANLRRAGFVVDVAAHGHSAVATRVFDDEQHGETKITLQLYQRDTEIFEAMSDPDVNVVLYTGHSGVGGNAKLALETAAAQAGNPKLLCVLACRTKQNLPAIARRYPESHCLVSDNGTFAHDDKMLIQELFKGIAARKGYADIEAALEGRGPWEPENYVFPHEVQQLAYKDLDGDGRVNRAGTRRDLVYNVDLPSGRQNAVSFRPRRKAVDDEALAGGRVLDAVGWMNSVYFYHAEAFGNNEEWQRADQFRAAGWFSSDDKDEIVRITERVPKGGGFAVFEVEVNSAYSHLSSDALGMMLTWAMAEQCFAQTRPDESEYARRMRSLAMVCSYVVNLVPHKDVGDLLLANFAKRFGFPPGLSYDLASTAVNADYDNEASPKTVRALEKGLQYPFLEVNASRSSLEFRRYIQSGLEVLRKQKNPVAQKTFELIATGEVLVDELADLSREDFEHLRAEYAREGIDTDESWGPDAFLRLHDKRTRAYRAIKQDIDGYMWDDRVYVSPGLSPKALAKVLAHEVNHVLNESEESYRGKRAILVEEYRAHIAEHLAMGVELTPELCREVKREVIENYSLAPLTPDDIPDEVEGVL